MAGKVTVGLASHWPGITDISGSPPMGSRPRRRRSAPVITLLWSMVNFTFQVTVTCCPSDDFAERYASVLITVI